MSYAASSPVRPPAPARVPAGRVALVGLGAVLAATVANALVYLIGGMLVTYHAEFPALINVGPTIVFTLFAGIGAAVVYALILRFSRNPTRTFGITAAVVFVLTLIPDFTVIPKVPGATGGQTTVLLVMHVVAALVLVGGLTRFARPE